MATVQLTTEQRVRLGRLLEAQPTPSARKLIEHLLTSSEYLPAKYKAGKPVRDAVRQILWPCICTPPKLDFSCPYHCPDLKRTTSHLTRTVLGPGRVTGKQTIRRMWVGKAGWYIGR